MPPWLFVCPASRGIGLALARALLRTTRLPLVATARGDLEQTRAAILGRGDEPGREREMEGVDAGRLRVLRLDVTDEDSIAAAAQECAALFGPPPDAPPAATLLASSHLHLAFVLPGILHPERSLAQIDAAKARDTLLVNLLGPMLVAKHFAPLLPRKATPLPPASGPSSSSSSGTSSSSAAADEDIDDEERAALGGLPPSHGTLALMSARVGSISDNAAGGWFSYRASKAGVAQLARTLDLHLRARAGGKAGAVALHPGTVRTDFSREFWGSVPAEKLFGARFAAERLLGVVKGGWVAGAEEGARRLGWDEARGRCWDWRGVEVPP